VFLYGCWFIIYCGGENLEGCEIRIYNADFEWIDVVRMPQSVQFARDIYGAGNFEIHIHPESPGALSLCGRGNIIMIDGRQDITGVVRNFSLSDSVQNSDFIIYGETGAGFFRQRVCVPPTNVQVPLSDGFDKITSNAESVLKHYVNRNVVNPYDISRKIENFSIAVNKNRGQAIQWQARYTELLEELSAIGEQAQTGFKVTADVIGKKWIFDVLEGTDRTRQQSVLSPVTFTMEFQNVAEYSYTEDYSEFRNMGYAGGKGDAAARQIAVINGTKTGRNRYETFLDCSGAENTTELNQLGKQLLGEMTASTNIEASALPRVFEFEKDYFLGDIVTLALKRFDMEIPVRVTAVKEIWERQSGHKMELRFGEKLPDIFSVLTQRKLVK